MTDEQRQDLLRREFLAKSGAVVAAGALTARAGAAQESESTPGAGAVYAIEDLLQQRRDSGGPYIQFLRVPALHAGIYSLKAGAPDPQPSHAEDEIYYVLNGKARIRVEDEDFAVQTCSVIYVRAKADHKFHNIEEDLDLLVFFSTAAPG